jgi:hypothetical protein
MSGFEMRRQKPQAPTNAMKWRKTTTSLERREAISLELSSCAKCSLEGCYRQAAVAML